MKFSLRQACLATATVALLSVGAAIDSAPAQAVDIYVRNKPFKQKTRVDKKIYVPFNSVMKAMKVSWKLDADGNVICNSGTGNGPDLHGTQFTVMRGSKSVPLHGVRRDGALWVPLEELAVTLGFRVEYTPETDILDIVASRNVTEDDMRVADEIAAKNAEIAAREQAEREAKEAEEAAKAEAAEAALEDNGAETAEVAEGTFPAGYDKAEKAAKSKEAKAKDAKAKEGKVKDSKDKDSKELAAQGKDAKSKDAKDTKAKGTKGKEAKAAGTEEESAAADSSVDKYGVKKLEGDISAEDLLKKQAEIDAAIAAKKKADTKDGEAKEKVKAPPVAHLSTGFVRCVPDYMTGNIVISGTVRNSGTGEASKVSAKLVLKDPDGNVMQTKTIYSNNIASGGVWTISESYHHVDGDGMPRGRYTATIDVSYEGGK